MADDIQQELKRLERELLTSENIDDDDLLSDLPHELFDTQHQTWAEDEEVVTGDVFMEDDALTVDDIIDDILAEEKNQSVDDIINETLKEAEFPSEAETPEGENMKTTKEKTPKDRQASQKREDRWLIVLMAIACFLCVGIIGILIYWLEAFLK